MKLLAIDTTEQACSAALLLEGEIHEKFEVVPRRHSQLLLPMVDALLAEAELSLGRLDALAFGRGPGSFTGVRIATAAAQGLGMAADLPVAAVSSLLALAQGALRETEALRVLAAFDARMQELYWLPARRGTDDLAEPAGPERVSAAEAVRLPEEGPWWVAGSGAAAAGEVLLAEAGQGAVLLPDVMVHAADVARLAVPLVAAGETVSAAEAQPVYLREQVARKMAGS
ncbi:MAG: tRNA (adenosine(37)-N6)-threonylcarbamoyltransferase complex dimerization subunit type 1 TsaB [Gammaproteobacteria bacterium]|nr:MAG: tRNA (adenosine(37)-N6)-threonylcarbamoyltransferase complex dimerization subunit type 1 TsaB [Gammaproteobacteria bacterium]